MQVNGAGKQERQQRSQQASMQRNRLTSSCPAFYDGPSLRASHYMPKTTMRPSSWHIHSDNFGVWPYISSEYSREKEELAKQKRLAHALQMSEKDFIVPSSVLPVKGLCCFGNYEYDLNPYPVTASTSFCTTVHSACIHACTMFSNAVRIRMYSLPSQSRQLPCCSQLANLADQQNVLFELLISSTGADCLTTHTDTNLRCPG